MSKATTILPAPQMVEITIPDGGRGGESKPDRKVWVYEGIDRRYGAGISSLLQRAECNFYVNRRWRIDAEGSYDDCDVMSRVSAGDIFGTGREPSAIGSREVFVEFTCGLHVTGGGRVESRPLRGLVEGVITVRSARTGEVTSWHLRKEDAQRLAERFFLEEAFTRAFSAIENPEE